jgi:Rieske 2Fe-2S family protein
MAPNFTLFGRIDCVRTMITWPLSESRCRCVIYHLFPAEFFDRPDFEKKRKIYHDYQITVLEEDRTMIESMQQAMASRAYDPGQMSVLEEPLHHFLNGHLDRMFGPPDDRPDDGEAAE